MNSVSQPLPVVEVLLLYAVSGYQKIKGLDKPVDRRGELFTHGRRERKREREEARKRSKLHRA